MPVALNVQQADVPDGYFLLLDDRLASPAAVAKADGAPAATFARIGVLAASQRVFSDLSENRGYLFASVYSLRSPAAAHAFYRLQIRRVAGSIARTLGPTGDEGLDLDGVDTRSGKPTSVNAAIFRRGSSVVELGVSEWIAGFSHPLALRLAHLVDARIRHAGQAAAGR